MIFFIETGYSSATNNSHMNIMSGDLLSTNCADCNFLHQVIRTKYKHITLAATIIVFLCVLFSWPEEYTLSTVGRAGVISNESIPTVKVRKQHMEKVVLGIDHRLEGLWPCQQFEGKVEMTTVVLPFPRVY